MYASLYRNVLLPLHQRVRGRKACHYWKVAKRAEWSSYETLQEQQLQALRALLGFASKYSPYYQQLFQSRGITPKIDSLELMQAIPLLTRQTIAANASQLRSHLARSSIKKSTGGSSGEPLHFELCRDSDDRRTAMMYRGYEWAGLSPGTRTFYLWGSSLQHRIPSWLQRKKVALHQRLQNQYFASCFETTLEDQARHHAALMQFQPKMLVAYTNPLLELAKFIRDRKLRVPQLAGIIVGAEKLYPFQRETMEEVFQAPVFETYGSREFMLIGAECSEHAGLHLSIDNLLVEIVDEAGLPVEAGQSGSVVITDLFNYAMPFIRYVTGDQAIAGYEACACGRGLPLLRSVQGRTLDVLTTKSGRKIPGELFPHLIKDFPSIRRFQVEQRTLEEIILRLESHSGQISSDIEQIEMAVRAVIGDTTRLSIESVDRIPLTGAGKLRVVINHLQATS